MLSKLPLELLDKVLFLITDVKDLYSLCHVSKALHARSLPLLRYQRPTILYANNEHTDLYSETDVFDLEVLKDLANDPDHPYRKSRCLQFKSRSWPNTKERCFHLRELSAELKEQSRLECGSQNHVRDYWSRRTGIAIGPLLKKVFKHGQIEEFSWELGICPPKGLLGSTGFLPRHQALSITRLNLITGAICDYNLRHANASSLSLEPFRALTHLVWIGIVTLRENTQLRLLLCQNGSQLEHLQLDFGNTRAYPHNHDTSQATIFANVLENTGRFSRLHTLSLTDANLYDEHFSHCLDSRVYNGFEWPNLRKLSLVRCLGAASLMNYLSEYHARSLKLKTFELVTDSVDADCNEDCTIMTFLAELEGLENLYLHVEAIVYPSTDIWETVARSHRTNLRRFAYELNRWYSTSRKVMIRPISPKINKQCLHLHYHQ